MSADETHPVILCAKAVIRSVDGAYVLEPRGAALLEIVILEQPQDEALKEALLTLFGLVVILHDELASVAAAQMLLMVLGRVKPRLQHLGTDLATVATLQRDELGEQVRALLGAEPKSAAQKLRGAPPPGSVSVRSLDISAPRPRKAPMPGQSSTPRADPAPPTGPGLANLKIVPSHSGRR